MRGPMTDSSTSASPAPQAPALVSESIVAQIAAELSVEARLVQAVIQLIAEGATVPFIARYRKERTGGLDEVAIRTIAERKTYLAEMVARRVAIKNEIEGQGKLTDLLKRKIDSATTKAELEDLYLPFKPKRTTRGMKAKERGLLPLAEAIWAQGAGDDPQSIAAQYVNQEKEVPDEKAALSGARDILAEQIAEDAELRQEARRLYLEESVLRVHKTKAFEDKVTKFDNYAQFSEPVAKMASHRYLAVRRGESEGVLAAALEIEENLFGQMVEKSTPLSAGSPWASELSAACEQAASRHLLPSAQMDARVELKMRADREAVEVFATNLRELLMAAPFGTQAVIGIDPGQRTGCKVVALDQTGKLLSYENINLVMGEAAEKRAEETFTRMCLQYLPRAIAVGNGTHGRETETFVRRVLKTDALQALSQKPLCVSVSESGASIYSASDVAREEFPDLDLTIRGAISIARRLQDPLAELVKLDPKTIGVGQYQHDVFQIFLGKKLNEVVESCVHEVGVELNTASASLLGRVSGLGPSVAKRIVEHRNAKGSFLSREQLLTVTGLGPRAFEQAAGFLRIRGAAHPLDASAVHPERYSVVERIAGDLGVDVSQLVGSHEMLARIDRTRYLSDDLGALTLDDIMAELMKPGRDPRQTFVAPQFRDDVTRLEDLKPNMRLEGVVTNVTAFGAFVDVGVHQDGLVHVSRLADKFVKNPSEVVKVGDKLSVIVLEVDLERKRVSLSAKKGDTAENQQASTSGQGATGRPARSGARPQGRSKDAKGSTKKSDFGYNPFADILRR